MPYPISLNQELVRIIENELITTLFQPIVDLTTGEISGYEALSRGPQASPLHSPLDLFKAAREANKLFALEKVCRKQALLNFERINKSSGCQLFLNVDPQVVDDSNFKSGITLESFVEFADKINSILIAEGIERREELNLLTELGITCGQGYFIARPAKKPNFNGEIKKAT